jgi:hypothetical protein
VDAPVEAVAEHVDPDEPGGPRREGDPVAPGLDEVLEALPGGAAVEEDVEDLDFEDGDQ